MVTLKCRSLPYKFVLGVFAVATVCGLPAVKARAATYYWDTNGGTAGAGGTPNGTWGTSNYYWSTSSSGTASSLSPVRPQPTTSILSPVLGQIAVRIPIRSPLRRAKMPTASSFNLLGLPSLSGAGAIILWGSGGITVSQFGYGFTPQGPVTISPDIILQASQTWTNKSSNRLTIGSVVNGGNSMTIAGPGKTLVSGVISGSGGLAKVGAGTLTMTGSTPIPAAQLLPPGSCSLATAQAAMMAPSRPRASSRITQPWRSTFPGRRISRQVSAAREA